ncbi:MAG: phosphatase PAP2 family protein [Bacteroidia bacterium]|nr:phosphatase PAP2 family protein [Bacteroidia bacterium]
MDNSFFYKHKSLYVFWLLWMAAGLSWVALNDKGQAILDLNHYYNGFTVPFFSFFTRMAEVMGVVLPLVYLLIFKSIREQLGFLMVAVLTLSLVYFFKNIVYDDAIRPIVYFERLGIELTNRSEITLNRKHSFPSGHTAAGFAYFMYLGLNANKKVLKAVFMVIAMLIGISRVFLAQHFVIDIMAGSALGVFIATVVYYFWIFGAKESSKLDRKLFNA